MNLHRASAAIIACSLFCAVPAACAEPPSEAPDDRRIVAVGDLHGDLPQALAVLRLAGIVDEAGAWVGGATVLVQTGDTTDRGPQSKEVIDLVKRLGSEAEVAGGKVVALMGNHEAMNLQGDWRYVDAGDVAGFGGLEARVAAMTLSGEYGSWLLDRDAVAIEGDAVFVHGGVTPEWAAQGVGPINEAVRAALSGGPPAALGEGGPLWFRGFAQDAESKACPELQRSLTALGVARMVVGHTTQRSGKIGVRCDGRLHTIDVGISSHYGGNLAAWEWTKGNARALYPSGPVDLEDPAP